MKIKNIRHNFNKSIKLHTVCSTCKYRPIMNYIYFDNGYAVATNANVLVKAYLKEVSSFTDDEIEMLNGKLLHRNSYAELIKHNVVSVEADGFLIETDVFNMKIKFYDGEPIKYPNYQKIFSDLNKKGVDRIGIDSNKLSLLSDSVNESKLKMEFNGETYGVMVRFDSEELSNSFGMVMPFSLDY